MGMSSKARTALILFAAATVVYAISTRRPHGRLLGVPFDWRIPSLETVRGRLWNPSDDRLIQPTVFGVGWAINLHQALVRLGVLEPEIEPGEDRFE